VTVAVLTLSGFLPLPATVPVLPPSALAEDTTLATVVDEMGTDLAEQIGWPELVRTVAGVYESLPAEDRNRATILTLNYGEAGAIERYGPALGLPLPFSGHNSYAEWGPPGEPTWRRSSTR